MFSGLVKKILAGLAFAAGVAAALLGWELKREREQTDQANERAQAEHDSAESAKTALATNQRVEQAVETKRQELAAQDAATPPDPIKHDDFDTTS